MPRAIAEDLKFLKRAGAGGTASQSNSLLFRSLGPNYYTYAKFSWNTNADLGRVLDDYYRHAYGPGAAAARKVFDLWEGTYNKGGDYFRYDWSIIVPLFTPAVRAELVARARAAEPLGSPAGGAAGRRTGQLRLVIEFLDALMEFARTQDKAARKKLDELAKGPFLSSTEKSFSRADSLHREGK